MVVEEVALHLLPVVEEVVAEQEVPLCVLEEEEAQLLLEGDKQAGEVAAGIHIESLLECLWAAAGHSLPQAHYKAL